MTWSTITIPWAWGWHRVCIITCLLCSWYNSHKEHWNILEKSVMQHWRRKYRWLLRPTDCTCSIQFYLVQLKVMQEMKLKLRWQSGANHPYLLPSPWSRPSSASVPDQHQSRPSIQWHSNQPKNQPGCLGASKETKIFPMNALLICSRLHKQIYVLFK